MPKAFTGLPDQGLPDQGLHAIAAITEIQKS
jgi:hypothetical protein